MRWENLLWAVAALTISAGWLVAGDRGGCVRCGCSRDVRKVCRAVCEMKKVSETKYKMECEDFCIPGPSGKCDCKWIPGCGEVRTKRKLVKYEETTEKPSYKWVVEYRCPTCCAGCADLMVLAPGQEPPATVPTPAAPPKTAAGEIDPPSPIRSTGLQLPALRLSR